MNFTLLVPDLLQSPWWAGPLVAFAVLTSLAIWPRCNRLARAAIASLLLTLVILGCLGNAAVVRRNLGQEPDWDFKAFWVAARTSALGLSPYNPEHLVHGAAGISVSDDFQKELIQGGFAYPPPTVLLLAPLGWMEFGTAMSVWYGIHIAFLATAIWLIWKEWLLEHGALGLVACAILALWFRPTTITLSLAQVHFAGLFTFLLFWRSRDCWGGGVWLAIACLAKPVFAPLALFPLLRGRWRPLAGAAIAGAALFAASLAVLGTGLYQSYLLDSPLQRRPPGIYVNPPNQSLLAVVWRFAPLADERLPFFHPLYLGSAVLLLGAACWLVYRNRSKPRGDEELALLLATAILVYPGTLDHYAFLLLAPLALLWKLRGQVSGQVAIVTLLICSVFALTSRGGKFVFVAIALTWAAMVLLSWRSRSSPGQ
jgi:hypothetical protein